MDSEEQNIDIELLDLFKVELENHASVLENHLNILESDQTPDTVAPLMRAAHSIKGASRIVGINMAAQLSRLMEDVLSAVHREELVINTNDIDTLLKCNDIFVCLKDIPITEINNSLNNEKAIIDEYCSSLQNILHKDSLVPKASLSNTSVATLNSNFLEVNTNDNLEEDENEEDEEQEEIDIPLTELFKVEVENHSRVLEKGLVDVEVDQSPESIEPLMRAAHSLKGASRIMGLDIPVKLSHAMEDLLTTAQKSGLKLNSNHIDLLLQGNDYFTKVSSLVYKAIPKYFKKHIDEIDLLSTKIRDSINWKPQKIESQHEPIESTNAIVAKNSSRLSYTQNIDDEIIPKPKQDIIKDKSNAISQSNIPENTQIEKNGKNEETFVRVISENLNRLMGLAGETLVQAKSIKPLSNTLYKLKNELTVLNSAKEAMFDELKDDVLNDLMRERFQISIERLNHIRDTLIEHIEQFELFTRRIENTAERLYNEAITTRMKPFSEGLYGFPRMIRDLAKQLNKKINFEIRGSTTRVDRDILEKLESPLTHLIRNAIDHGIETPDTRISLGKEAEGSIIIEARHSSGMLVISIKDDGKGIDPEMLRKKVVEKGYTNEEMASLLTTPELMEFLFLPGFSTAKKVTEISGRGVGLDVVFSMVHEVGGTIRAESTPGKGTIFMLNLPLTLSVIRSLLVIINNEAYAFPLSRIDRIVKIQEQDLKILEDRQYYIYENENIGIADARQLFRLSGAREQTASYSIVIISDRLNRYGLVVDKFLGERDLVVIQLDKKLGKIPIISAGAILEDGSPVLIVDVDDIVRSIDNLLAQIKPNKIGFKKNLIEKKKKRILVVDDSMTVREVERKLLENKGYEVEIAVDGMDGWNVLNNGRYDLIISDVDMPRMNGIDFVARIKNNIKLKDLPVMIVSYKDREDDKIKGLEAGANYYLTKSSFHDASMVNAVVDLIGEP